MSFNQPPPPPGYGVGQGYGQQPPPPQPPQSDYGYPRQPTHTPPQPGPTYTQPGYSQPGYAQPGYAQQPYEQQTQAVRQLPQDGWGGPSAPPPARRSRAGLVIGIAIAVAVVAGGTTIAVMGGDDANAKYKLTMPQTAAHVYQRQGEGKTEADMEAKDKAALDQIPGLADPHGVSTQYQTNTKKALYFTGVWGTVANPEQSVDALFALMSKEAAEDQDAEPVGSPQSVTPDGLDSNAVMKCQSFKLSSGSASLPVDSATMPMCVWGDTSTVAMVMVIDPLALAAGTGTSIDEAATTAADVRADARVKIEE